MSVHLNTLLLPVGVVGLTWSPVSVGNSRVVHPAVQVKQRNISVDLWCGCHKEKILSLFATIWRVKSSFFRKDFPVKFTKHTYWYCPLAMPDIHIPIQAAVTSPVPTWKSETDVTQTCFAATHDNIHSAVKAKAYHGVDEGLFLCAVDADEPGFLLVAADHCCVEVHDVSVVVIVADVVVLPPAGVWPTVGS